MTKRISTYDKAPLVAVAGAAHACVAGWPDICERLKRAVQERGGDKIILAVECYPGVYEDALLQELQQRLKPQHAIAASDALKRPAEVDRLCAPFLGGDDPVFGYLSPLTLEQFFAADKKAALAARAQAATGLVLIVGSGATLLAEPDILAYADLARWEIQQRQRRNLLGNLGVSNASASAGAKYKRGFFIDWRVADRWKKPLLSRMDFLLDTNQPESPKLVEGDAVRRGLTETVRRPFRLVPFFDPGPWGGQWMKEICDLPPTSPNYAWCFDCVPEENSLRLGFGPHRVELPALDLVFFHPRTLLGDPVHARFGEEFPIRFDFLDTMGGGNLSFQVHPLTEYIQEKFGMHYTQDESYYLLDADPDACVYLGLKEGVDPGQMAEALARAQAGGAAFPAEKFVNRWPARKHDHFLIPAGTCHCSGRDSMVLEISATPYIFTFKMWDWERLGLDGQPRPIHLEHGLANIQWDRTTAWVRNQLINRVVPLEQGEGWSEERTGLHEREFIETRRHWFTGTVPHHTGGTDRGSVQVVNLVQGDEAVVESPDQAFEPFPVHYAETFIVPAGVGPYLVRPVHPVGEQHATIKAFIRTGVNEV